MRRLGRFLSSVPPTHRDNNGTSATQSPFGVGSSAANHVISRSVSCAGSTRFLISSATRTLNIAQIPDDAAARAAEPRRLALETHRRRATPFAPIMLEPPPRQDNVADTAPDHR